MTPALCGTCSAPSSPSGWCSPTPPTASVSSSPNQTTPNRLTPETLQLIGRAAAQDPALLVVLALVGVHALGPGQARLLTLEQLDLPNARLDIGGTTRTMDPFTADAIGQYLAYRHNRWPRSNPHLLVTRRTPFSWAPSLPGWQNNESKPEGPWVHEF